MQITLTDDNVEPKARNYTMVLSVVENINLIEKIEAPKESSKKEYVSVILRSMHSDGKIVLSLSQALLADNYELLIQNLTNSLTVNISSPLSSPQSPFRW